MTQAPNQGVLCVFRSCDHDSRIRATKDTKSTKESRKHETTKTRNRTEFTRGTIWDKLHGAWASINPISSLFFVLLVFRAFVIPFFLLVSLKMPKNLMLAAALPAAPDRLYDMYLDPQAHAAFTGMPVTISPQAGSPFRAFDGQISGAILHVEPKRLIVQRWRSVNWPAGGVDSVLVLSFLPDPGGGRIELVQVNVADEDFPGVSHGWEKYYWTPWREYLTR